MIDESWPQRNNGGVTLSQHFVIILKDLETSPKRAHS